MKHFTVLKKESIEALNIKSDGIYVDATLGYAGDSGEILKRINKGYLFAFDRDQEAISYSKNVLNNISDRYETIHAPFSKMKEELAKRNIDQVDGILFDLGVSSPQLDEERGFSFMRDELLDMRMDQEEAFNAMELINTYQEEQLKEIFYRYGEEKRSSFIAKKICEERKKKKITTTKELCDIIMMSVGKNYFYKNHPERPIFQAIRIEVNKELQEIETTLPIAISLLKPGGRIVVVTFHSLEDRLVKKIFKKYSEIDPMVQGLPEIPQQYQPLIKLINKKPILPSNTEISLNSRSASAKLRIAERI